MCVRLVQPTLLLKWPLSVSVKPIKSLVIQTDREGFTDFMYYNHSEIFTLRERVKMSLIFCHILDKLFIRSWNFMSIVFICIVIGLLYVYLLIALLSLSKLIMIHVNPNAVANISLFHKHTIMSSSYIILSWIV